MGPTKKFNKNSKKPSEFKVEDSIVKKIASIKAKNAAPKPETVSEVTKDISKKAKKRKREKPPVLNADQDGEGQLPSGALMLKDVIDLGGTQEDYDLLQNVSDTEEMEITDTAEGLDIGEIVRFMKSNGLQAPKKEKKKKIVEKETDVSEKKEEVQQPKCPFAPSNPPPHEKLLFKTSEPW